MDNSRYGLGGDVPVASRFILTVDGVQIGVFREVSGLSLTVGVEEFLEGGTNGFTHKFPGRVTYPNIVFKRGITDSDALFDWVNKSAGDGFDKAGGKIVRDTAAITVVDILDNFLRIWNFEGAFAVRWSGPTLSVDSSVALEEELEMAHHGFVSVTPP